MGSYPTKEIIVISGELCDLNNYVNAERGSRFAGAEIKKEETERCQWACKGKKKFTSPVWLVFTWFVSDKRKDPDNIAFAKKFILDAMVKEGVLTNDGQKQVKGWSDNFEVDSKNPRVEIVLSL